MKHFHGFIKSVSVQLMAAALLLIPGIIGNPVAVLAEGSGDQTVNKPAVLPPEKFVGKVALGYKAAQAIPEICSKLFCYCGCDLTDNHTSLLDCFTCIHGMDCDICQDEAIVALHLKEQGKSLREIQQTIDTGFAYQYPWDKPSPTLIKYRQAFNIESKSAGTVSGVKSRPGKCCAHKGQNK